jgi:sugar/nucleoside kinase (ribokinase family)/fructoselysine-6-P-deglycase FrlB-like protein
LIKTILGSGLVAVDHIFLTESKRKSPTDFKYLGSAGGGSISNSLCLLSLLGYKTSVFGLVGNDLGERIIKMDFDAFGINHHFLVKRGSADDLRSTRQFSHLIFADGSHRFKMKCLGCSASFKREYQINVTDVSAELETLAGKTDLLLLDRANKANLQLALSTKKGKGRIAYNLSFGSYGSYLENTKSILRLCDLVQVNDRVFEKLMGSNDKASISRWMEQYPETAHLLITKGEKGVYGYTTVNAERVIFDYDMIPCDHLRDAGGAGDVFLSMATSELLLKTPPSTIIEFKEKIDLAQSLASLSCSLYGARALQRAYLTQKVTPQEILESAAHINKQRRSGNSFSPTIGLPKPISKPYRFTKLDACDICGNINLYKKKKINRQAKKQARFSIHHSLTQAPWTMMTSYEQGKAHNIDALGLVKYNSLLVGSGGSFTAAVFGETIYLKLLSKVAKAITPFEFEGYKNIDEDTAIWFISHGGGNTDILGSALNAMKIDHSRCIVLTGNKNSTLARLAIQNKWKAIFMPTVERNFVSIIGLLSQISALCGLLANVEEPKLNEFFSETNLLKRFNSSMKRMESLAQQIALNSEMIENIHLICLARGWGWPALIDLESKIVEGGICTVEISELKNFTHGRYLNLYGHPNRRVILLKTPDDAELVNYLQSKFKRYTPTFLIETDESGIIGSIDLMIQVVFFASYLGQIAKKDILKPKFPPEARGLYSWESSSRRGFWKNNVSKENNKHELRRRQLPLPNNDISK